MTPEETQVDFRIVDEGTEEEAEETGFVLLDVERDVGLVPVDERWAIVPVE